MMRNFISMLLVMLMASTIDAFVTGGVWSHRPAFVSTPSSSSFYAANGEDDNDLPTLKRVSPNEEGLPIPFVDLGRIFALLNATPTAFARQGCRVHNWRSV